MQSIKMNSIRRIWMFVVVLVAGLALCPKSHAQEWCNGYSIVDSAYSVEQQVCIETDGSQYFGMVETDANGYVPGEFDPYYLAALASEVVVYGPTGFTPVDSGMQPGGCCALAETAPFSLKTGTSISDYYAVGSFEEYLYGNGSSVYYADWYGPYSGLTAYGS